KETPVSVSISFNASNISLATSIEPTLPMRSPITSEVEQPTIQSSSFLKKDLDFSSSNNALKSSILNNTYLFCYKRKPKYISPIWQDRTNFESANNIDGY